ncbi:MAG: hypothetical protein WDM77_12620 [Steroidobacteraceae bacterium]
MSEQFTNTQTNADGSISSYTGAFQYSNESIEPKFKGLMAIDYGLGGFTLHYDARYLERTTNFDGSAPDTAMCFRSAALISSRTSNTSRKRAL